MKLYLGILSLLLLTQSFSQNKQKLDTVCVILKPQYIGTEYPDNKTIQTYPYHLEFIVWEGEDKMEIHIKGS